LKRTAALVLVLTAGCAHMRPIDRAGTVMLAGAATMLAGGLLVGVNSRCTETLNGSLETPVCPQLYDTRPAGDVMVYIGAPIAVISAIWMDVIAIREHRQHKD